MTRILCWKDDCKYQTAGSVCDCAQISIDEDGECECFRDYHDDVEWKSVFWKRMYDRKNKRECRVRSLGKKLEFGGRSFYIESNSYYAKLTDKETGLLCGDLSQINENVDVVGKIKKAAENFTPVLELPQAIYDEKTEIFIYLEEEKHD